MISKYQVNIVYFQEDTEMTREELERIHFEKSAQLKQLEENSGKDTNYIKLLSEIAFIELELDSFEEAESKFFTCLAFFKKQLDRLGQASVLGTLGTLYYKQEKYEKSIDYYEKALKIYDDLNQQNEQIICLKAIGHCSIKLNQFEKARDILLDCSSICSDNDDLYNLLDCLGELIHIHESLKEWDVVLELYLKTLEAFEQLKDNKGLIITNFNLGILQKRNGNYEEALRCFKVGTNIAIEANYAELIIKGLGYVGEIL
ncbi:MAG: tetratricopeptide repeat protein, partial [Promethearchaeota archaeon]